MDRGIIDQITDRWHNDAAFRSALRADPEGTLAREGIQLSADERAALRNLDVPSMSNLSDAELEARINRDGGC